MLEPLKVLVTRWTLGFDGIPPELSPARLRGALLIRYRRAVCPRSRWNDRCDACPLLAGCSYGQVFAARPVADVPLRRYRTLPRPYLFRPDPRRRDRFELVLVGAATALLPRFVEMFRKLGERGFVRGSPRFTVAAIEEVCPTGVVPLDPASPPRARPLDEWVPPWCGPDVRIRFLTPTTVRDREQVLRRPEPGPVLRRLRDRLAALGAAWCGRAPRWPYRRLGEMADAVRLEAARVHWVERKRRSGTTGRVYPVSGFVGTAVWRGLDPTLWPILAAGAVVGVGRHCAFGNGWLEVESAASRR